MHQIVLSHSHALLIEKSEAGFGKNFGIVALGAAALPIILMMLRCIFLVLSFFASSRLSWLWMNLSWMLFDSAETLV
jgi:hypothetical protein